MELTKKQQHAVGLAECIKHFTSAGLSVFVPVSDHNRYDLVVDMRGNLLRIEVKTTSSKTGDVQLRTLGGNQSWSGEVKRISTDDCDILFAMNTRTGNYEVFDSSELVGRNTVRVK